MKYVVWVHCTALLVWSEPDKSLEITFFCLEMVS